MHWRVKAGLPAFSYESEATALFARMSSAPADGRAYCINRLIYRLKIAGLWDKISAGWALRNHTEADSLLQLKSSSFNATKVSTPSFTANVGWTTDANTKYLDTGWSAAAVDKDDFHMAFFCNTVSANAASEFGAIDGSSNGISFNPRTAGDQVSFRANSAAVTPASTTISDGFGFFVVSVSGGQYQLYRNGKQVASGSITTLTPVAGNVYIGKVNGGTSVSGRSLGWLSFGTALTAQEALDYYAAVFTYLDAERGGHPDIHEPGYQPTNVTADVIVYGATLQGCLAAREAARQGLSVVIVGGWRERCVGGMSTNGISVLDMDTASSIGGLVRLWLTRINTLQSASDSPPATTFQPRIAEMALRGFLDPARADGASIPVYWSQGVQSVFKNSTVIESLRTVDGRSFYGAQFIDASYEGDLLAKAGCTYIVGREAAGSGNEALSGERNLTETDNGNQSQYYIGGAGSTVYNVDPYNTPGDSGSGRIFGVNAPSGVATGTADSKIQSYNFRLTLSATANRRIDQQSRPDDFTLANFEAFFRFLQELVDNSQVYGSQYDIEDLLLFAPVENSNYADVNQRSGFGPNFYGQNWSYPEATYAQREVIWKAHEAHVRGLFYVMSYGRTVEGETRIPAAMETAMQAWGLNDRIYLDPFEGDDYFWPRQLYIRQARRLVGDFVYNGNDLGGTDGQVPRSTKTIGCASYSIDPHHAEAIADPNAGSPRIWNTGMVVKDVNGANNLSPLPMEIVMPKQSEVTNLTVPFCVSATHIAFGAIRMEPATAALAQACGIIAALAIDTPCNVQDVDYAALRTALLASNTLGGEVDPVIPQTH